MWIDNALYAAIKEVIPIPTVDIVVIRGSDEKVLLLKRNNEPAKGKWWVSGGRINRGESTLEAALRKLEEETGIKADRSDLDVICGPISVDYGSVHTITVATYRVRLDEEPKVTLNNEHSEFRWAGKEEALNLLDGQARAQYLAAVKPRVT